MSKRVIFTCTLLLLLGLLAAWDTFSHLKAGQLHLNIGVFFIPSGIGLFLGKPSARSSTVAVFFLIYAFCAFVLIASLFSSASIRLFGINQTVSSGFPFVFVVVAIICAVVGLIHWTLYSPPFEDHLS